MDLSTGTTSPPGLDSDAVQAFNKTETVLRLQELCERMHHKTHRQRDGALHGVSRSTCRDPAPKEGKVSAGVPQTADWLEAVPDAVLGAVPYALVRLSNGVVAEHA